VIISLISDISVRTLESRSGGKLNICALKTARGWPGAELPVGHSRGRILASEDAEYL